jgi:phage shock protein A
MKQELERMEAKVEELKSQRGTLIAKAERAKSASAGVEGMGSRTGGKAFDEFRRMEDQIEGVEAAFQAQREVDEVLGGGRGPGGMTPDEVEAKFRNLEHGGGGESKSGGNAVDDELAALKKKVRIGS